MVLVFYSIILERHWKIFAGSVFLLKIKLKNIWRCFIDSSVNLQVHKNKNNFLNVPLNSFQIDFCCTLYLPEYNAGASIYNLCNHHSRNRAIVLQSFRHLSVELTQFHSRTQVPLRVIVVRPVVSDFKLIQVLHQKVELLVKHTQWITPINVQDDVKCHSY